MKAVGPSRSKIAVFTPFIFRGVGYFSLDAGYSPFPPFSPRRMACKAVYALHRPSSSRGFDR
jgi:hypothetical protein